MNNVKKVIKKSIIQKEPYCYECGSTLNLQEHHCIHGSFRKKADEDGLTVLLCANCHFNLHHNQNELDKKYKILAQRAYVKKYSFDAYMRRYIRNYDDNDQW